MTEHAHMGVRLNHAGITDETKPFYVQMGMAKARKTSGLVEITPQQMEMHQRLLTEKMQEAEHKQKPKPPFVQHGEVKANAVPGKNDNMTLVTHGR